MVVSNRKIPTDIELFNAIPILNENISIFRDKNKCIDCGLCRRICEYREGINDIQDGRKCLNCGQCIQTCPVGALFPKSDINKFIEALSKNKICIAYIAPSVRVAIGDAFGFNKGEFVQGKLIRALHLLGCKYVFDVTFGADLTVVEEAAELIQRIKCGGKLPMFSSCCPSWVSYIEKNNPDLIPNLSTCKSPIAMQSAVIQNYFIKNANIIPENTVTVAITPCTSKKYEMQRFEIKGTDIVLTTKELILLLKSNNIDLKNLQDDEFDSPLGEGSGSGMLFGASGGVTESIIRTAYKIVCEKNLDKVNFEQLRGMQNVKTATIQMNDISIKVAVVHQLSTAISLLKQIEKKKVYFDFIEVMNCHGGCLGGGGMPKIYNEKEIIVKQKRMDAIYNYDRNRTIKMSHQNPNIIKIYADFLEHPLSEKAKELLHTKYQDKREEY